MKIAMYFDIHFYVQCISMENHGNMKRVHEIDNIFLFVGLIPALCRTFSVCCRIHQPQQSSASVIPVRNYSIATLRPVHSKYV